MGGAASRLPVRGRVGSLSFEYFDHVADGDRLRDPTKQIQGRGHEGPDDSGADLEPNLDRRSLIRDTPLNVLECVVELRMDDPLWRNRPTEDVVIAGRGPGTEVGRGPG